MTKKKTARPMCSDTVPHCMCEAARGRCCRCERTRADIGEAVLAAQDARWRRADPEPPQQPDAASSDWIEIPAEQDVRYALWVGHGHGITGLYGDDGEMQCNACPPPAQDYKRAPLSMLVRTALTALRAAPASPALAAWRALSGGKRNEFVGEVLRYMMNLGSSWQNTARVASDLLRSLAPEAGDADGGDGR